MPVFVHVSESSRRWAHQLDDRMERWRERHRLASLPSGTELAAMSPKKLRAALDNELITYDMLVELKQELAVVCAEIKTAVLSAKENARSGAYLPPKQFKALQAQQAKYGAKYATVEAELSKHKRAQKRINMRRRHFSSYFMDVAREELDPELFSRLCDLAHKAKRKEIE